MNPFMEVRLEGRRQGAWVGLLVGITVAGLLMTLVHLLLADWALQKHLEAQASIREADRILLSECQGIVVDLAGADYDTVVDLKRRIVEAQGRH